MTTDRIDDPAVLAQIRADRHELDRHIERHRHLGVAYIAAAERRLIELDRMEYGGTN